MDSLDTVAVVIACHDSVRTIGGAVRSALAEPEVAEVIVVDDASSDASPAAAIASDDGSGRLVLLRQPVNRGPAAARNLGMSVARSPWVAILDADDFFLPGRLAGLLRYAHDADIVADDPWRVREDAVDGPRDVVLGFETPRRITFAEFVDGNVSRPARPGREWGFVQPLVRRRFLDEHTLRYREHVRVGEDYELLARALALRARFVMLPPQGYVCVCREGSLSQRHSVDDLQRLLDCDAALAGLPGLTAADRTALRRHATSIECRLRWRLVLEALRAGSPARVAAGFLGPWPLPAHLLWMFCCRFGHHCGRRFRGRLW